MLLCGRNLVENVGKGKNAMCCIFLYCHGLLTVKDTCICTDNQTGLAIGPTP